MGGTGLLPKIFLITRHELIHWIVVYAVSAIFKP